MLQRSDMRTIAAKMIAMGFISLASLQAQAAATSRPTPKPDHVYIADTLSGHSAKNSSSAPFRKGGAATLDVVEVKGQPFTRAYRIQVLEPTKDMFGAALGRKVYADIPKGQVLMLSFAARSVSTSSSSVSNPRALAFVDLELARRPHRKTFRRTLPFGPEWKYYYLPFKSKFALDESQLMFQLGFGRQTLEIADIRLMGYEPGRDIESLPSTPVQSSYPGESEDATWRDEARQRIEKYRKADLKVTVVDHWGQPVPDAEVHIAMTRHEFPFGSMIHVRDMLADDHNGQIYRQKVAELFNLVVFGNAFKWKSNISVKKMEKVSNWLEAHHIPLRAHNLIWPQWIKLPKHLRQLSGQPETLRNEFARHVVETSQRWRGKVIGWDVVNEPVESSGVWQALGGEMVPLMADWFRLAHAADPAAQLFLNQNGFLASHVPGRFDYYSKLFQDLKKHNAPVTGIGMESHFHSPLPSPMEISDALDRFGKMGLPIKITEFDVWVPDAQDQANFTRDFYTVAFSHPEVKAILMWGFWAGSSYAPERAMFAPDWSPRPNFHAWHDLVFKKWWTDETKKTDRQGMIETRGFRGNYNITATAKGRTVSQKVTLGEKGANICILLGQTP